MASDIFRSALTEINDNFQAFVAEVNDVILHTNFVSCSWRNPRVSTLKINIDGSWCTITNKSGLGYLIHDSDKSCYLAVAAYFIVHSMLLAELFVIKLAL